MHRFRIPKTLIAAIVAAGLLAIPAPALAQKCTLGYDIGLNQDRNPSLCSFFKLPAGQAGFPITSGPDGRVWFFVRDQGALYAAKMTTQRADRSLPAARRYHARRHHGRAGRRPVVRR